MVVLHHAYMHRPDDNAVGVAARASVGISLWPLSTGGAG